LSQIETFGVVGRPHRLFRDRFTANRIAGDHMHADVAGSAHQFVHDTTVHNLKPSRAARFADDIWVTL
jgi:hypothetical protein